jgi:hypothetical protein
VNATHNIDSPVQAPLARAYDHLDTCVLHLTDAIDLVDGARRTRLIEVLDMVSSMVAALDRVRETL